MFSQLKKYPGVLIILLGICVFNFDKIHQSETKTAHYFMSPDRFGPPYVKEWREGTVTATYNEFWGLLVISIGAAVWYAFDFLVLKAAFSKKKSKAHNVNKQDKSQGRRGYK